MSTRAVGWAAAVAAVGALAAVLMAGVAGINAAEDDMEQVFGMFSLGAGTWAVPVVLVVATVIVAVIAVRRPRVGLIGAVAPVLATLAILSIRRAVLDDAREIDQWIRVEGTASVDSPLTRATRLHLTDMTARPFGQMMLAAGIGAALTAVFLLLAAVRARRAATV